MFDFFGKRKSIEAPAVAIVQEPVDYKKIGQRVWFIQRFVIDSDSENFHPYSDFSGFFNKVVWLMSLPHIIKEIRISKGKIEYELKAVGKHSRAFCEASGCYSSSEVAQSKCDTKNAEINNG